MSQEYYILSPRHSPSHDGLAVWWRPDDAGYTTDLKQAGRYSQERIDAHKGYYANGDGALAMPCDKVDAIAEIHTTVNSGKAAALAEGRL